jgi:hypothetical protein
MVRAELLTPLSVTQQLVVELLGLNLTHGEVGQELGISEDMAREHCKRAAKKIPGDLPAQVKCMMWARGANLDVLKGLTHRYEFQRAALQRPRTGGRPSQGGDVSLANTGS